MINMRCLSENEAAILCGTCFPQILLLRGLGGGGGLRLGTEAEKRTPQVCRVLFYLPRVA